MTARAAFRALLALPGILCGCGAQLGASTSASVRNVWVTPSNARAVWSPQATAMTVVGKGFYLGAEVESRSEHDVGARWTTGAQVGYALRPDKEPGSAGTELHFDFGSPLRDGSLFPNLDYYLGATAAMPIWISGRHDTLQNEAQWLLVRTAEIVPFLRFRYHREHPPDDLAFGRYDLGVGAAVRMMFNSDAF